MHAQLPILIAATQESHVFLSGWGWLWVAVLLGILTLPLLFWSYRAAPSGIARWLCPLFKSLGIAALAACLLEPMWSGQRARPGANLFAIVADNSQGMQIRDPGEKLTRGETLARTVDPQNAAWQATLEENFELRRYIFDARLQASHDFSELAFDGRASGIAGALRSITERYRNRPLAGVLLFTDGNATDAHGAVEVPGCPPVYPVVIGRLGPIPDIAVKQVRGNKTDFEDAPVTVQAEVSATGYRGTPLTAQLFDSQGKQVAEQTLDPRSDNEVLGFRFQLRPERPGTAFYKLNVRARKETSDASPQRTEEATLANNTGFVAVDRGHGPYRILYVSGRPNWEFKFLNRALQEDDQLQLTALIRVAKREPRFTFMGRAGETSNPLFRGFGNQSPEEVERYDKPVLVRLNTRNQQELSTGFPQTPEDLYQFHAVIIGDLEAEFFTADQQTLLQKFVSERGGGLLMLGGMESFAQGKYQRTPIGDMLPVYLDRTGTTNATGPFRLDLTREGWLQSWARLRDNEAEERARLQEMIPFQVFNTVREVKPGASVIATVSDAQGTRYPALAVQRFGHGRSAALTVGDLWRWGFHDAEAHTDMDKAWRQLMRWLVTDVPNRVDLVAEPALQEGNGAVVLEVRVRNEEFQPMDDASVAVEVKTIIADGTPAAQTNAVRLTAEAAPGEPGTYRATYLPRAAGCYRATVTVTNETSLQVGTAETGWSTDLASEEFHSLSPNIPLLEQLARDTGGQMIEAGSLSSFARSLPFRNAPVMEPITRPLWHTPAVFAFALACFISEWGLRRWKGLP